MKSIKTMLIAPPHFLYFNSVGIPQLTSYLESKGHQVRQILTDNSFFDFFLSKRKLERGFSCLHSNLKNKIEGELRDYILPIKDQIFNEYEPNKNLSSQILKNETQIIESILEAYREFKRKNGTIGRKKYNHNHLHIKLGLKISSLPFHPTTIDPMQGITMKYNPLEIDHIYKAIKDSEENPFIEFYEMNIFPEIQTYNPSLLGVQINHESQIIPAFTILDWVRRKLPSTKIIIGGSLVSYLKDQISKIKSLWQFFDLLGVGMGEYTLDKLILCLEKNLEYKSVPNLVYRKNKVVQETKFQQVDLNDLKVPNYEDSKPRPILPYFSASGCYWARCKFCEYPHHHNQFGCYNSKSVELIIKDLRQIKEAYNPSLIFFCDSDIHPTRLNQLSDALIEERLDLNLFIWIRAEEQFTSLKFCEKLKIAGIQGVWMGLEAGSQRVNDMMDKGINVNNVEQIIRNFNKVEIIVNLFSIVGLPGETKDEAMLTRNFFKRNKGYIEGDISISSFMLSTYSLISDNPDQFGIKVSHPKNGKLLYPILDYEIEEGITPKEAEILRERFREEFNDSVYTEGKFFISTMK
ncbi:MAG: hypothetical protein BAJALOKI2v1_50058 [Promethearchaeota archaeon]|nr:MAG: hypothetical protein BAJALOKI2v1_50058 [Candidatus Lokiarchaeota archaeon]